MFTLTSRFAAAFAALLLSVGSIGVLIDVAPATMPVISTPALA